MYIYKMARNKIFIVEAIVSFYEFELFGVLTSP